MSLPRTKTMFHKLFWTYWLLITTVMICKTFSRFFGAYGNQGTKSYFAGKKCHIRWQQEQKHF
jgi:hypothetical protein